MSLVQIEVNTPGELDVREIAPRQRHELIFATFDRLTPGQAFVLINDRDPKPLYYQFQAEQPGKVFWQYLEEGPDVWRVRIRRLHDLTTTPILELMLAYPQVKEVLDGFGLDTCCGSHMSVEEAAADSGVAAAPVFEALRNVLHGVSQVA